MGCADALFLKALVTSFIDWEFTGLEINDALLIRARKNINEDLVTLIEEDASTYASETGYDIITASGLLSVFDDPLVVLDNWIKLLKPGGKLFIFGTFNPFDMDMKISHRNNYNQSVWETGMHSFAQQTYARHLENRPVTLDFIPFKLPIDLEKDANPIRAHTVKDEMGNRIIIVGNVIKHFYFMTITNTSC